MGSIASIDSKQLAKLSQNQREDDLILPNPKSKAKAKGRSKAKAKAGAKGKGKQRAEESIDPGYNMEFEEMTLKQFPTKGIAIL